MFKVDKLFLPVIYVLIPTEIHRWNVASYHLIVLLTSVFGLGSPEKYFMENRKVLYGVV